MDHMEFSIALPSLVASTNAGVEWTTMKQRLCTHLNPTASNPHRGIRLRRPFLISIAAEQVQGIFNSYDVSFEEASKFSKILHNIEDLCLPRFLIIYNRFRFFTCKQNGPEFNGFLQQLLAWADLCEFGDLKDILLKDCIISGISEESVRQHLLRTEQLDFYKTVDICRAVLDKKESNSNDFVASDKLRADDSVNTYVEDPQETVKFSVATNTHQEIEDKGVQTHFRRYLDPMDYDILMNDVPKLRPANLADESCDPDSPEVYFPEPVLAQVTLPPTDVFSSDLDQHHADFSNASDKIHSGEQTCVNSHAMGDTSVNPSSQILHRSFSNRKPPVLPDQERLPEGCESKIIVKGSQSCGNGIPMQEQLCQRKGEPPVSQTSSKNAKIRCRLCKISFSDLPSLQKHRKTHEGEKKYCCDVCPSKFFNASHLKVHKRLHTGERPFVCNVCGNSYVEASKLKVHSRKHTGERPYKCDICHMTFTWSAAFKRHKKVHSGEKPFICDYCGSAFANFSALKRHTRTHTKEKPFRCDVCGYSFGDPSTLRAHKRIHTGERPYNCKFCGASFTRAQHVKEHMKLHLGLKPFKCDTCGAAFVEASKLKSHMRRHTGEKPYQCQVCQASFAWTAAYTRHMRTHTSEKPYPCKICGCSFADHSALIRHHRTHTGERPYPCKFCGSRFADSSSLTRHQRIHSSEKAFACEICGASFAVKSYLSRHIRIHTGEKPYGCDKCDAKFPDSSKLKRHQKIHDRPATIKEIQQQPQQFHHQHQYQHQQQQQQHQHQQHQLADSPLMGPPFLPNLSLRHELPPFQEEDIFNHFSKATVSSFDHLTKHDQHYDHLHGHDNEIASDIGHLSLPHAHDECQDLKPSVAATLDITPGIESFANILSFDS